MLRNAGRQQRFWLLVLAAAVLFATLLIVLASVAGELPLATRIVPFLPPPDEPGTCASIQFGDDVECQEGVEYGACLRKGDRRVWLEGEACPEPDACNPAPAMSWYLQSRFTQRPCASRKDEATARETCLAALHSGARRTCEDDTLPCGFEVLGERAWVLPATATPSPSPAPSQCTAECYICYYCMAR